MCSLWVRVITMKSLGFLTVLGDGGGGGGGGGAEMHVRNIRSWRGLYSWESGSCPASFTCVSLTRIIT